MELGGFPEDRMAIQSENIVDNASMRYTSGVYRGFVGDTVEAFRAAGLGLYNEAILVTAAGSLAMRTGAQFAATRKLGRTHQQMLVFVKGNSKSATRICGPIDVDESALGNFADQKGL